jgi:hypothetical protein
MTRILLALAFVGLAAPAAAGPERVDFPMGYQSTFIVYNQIERPDRTPNQIRFMYVNRDALAKASASAPAPSGTILIMEDRIAKLGPDGQPERDADGRLIPTDRVNAVFVMEKRDGWGAIYTPEKGNGDWEYAAFTPDGTKRTTTDAQVAGCFSCHQSRKQRDWTFTFIKYLQDVGK